MFTVTKKYSYFQCKTLVTSNHWSNVLFLLFMKLNICNGKLTVIMRSSAFEIKVILTRNINCKLLSFIIFMTLKYLFYMSFISKSNFQKEKEIFSRGILLFDVFFCFISRYLLRYSFLTKKKCSSFSNKFQSVCFSFKSSAIFFSVIVVHESYVVILVLFIYLLF